VPARKAPDDLCRLAVVKTQSDIQVRIVIKDAHFGALRCRRSFIRFELMEVSCDLSSFPDRIVEAAVNDRRSFRATRMQSCHRRRRILNEQSPNQDHGEWKHRHIDSQKSELRATRYEHQLPTFLIKPHNSESR